MLPTYDSLTPKELAEVSAKYLTFDRAAVVWALPAATTAPGVKPRAKVKAAGKGRTRAKAKAQPKAKPKPKPKAKTKRGSKA